VAIVIARIAAPVGLRIAITTVGVMVIAIVGVVVRAVVIDLALVVQVLRGTLPKADLESLEILFERGHVAPARVFV
jgi:hypothetical protein